MATTERLTHLDYATPSPSNRARFWWATVAGMVVRRAVFASGCAVVSNGIAAVISGSSSAPAEQIGLGGFLIGLTVPLGRWAAWGGRD